MNCCAVSAPGGVTPRMRDAIGRITHVNETLLGGGRENVRLIDNTPAQGREFWFGSPGSRCQQQNNNPNAEWQKTDRLAHQKRTFGASCASWEIVKVSLILASR